jgi:flagellar motor switch protein FliM
MAVLQEVPAVSSEEGAAALNAVPRLPSHADGRDFVRQVGAAAELSTRLLGTSVTVVFDGVGDLLLKDLAAAVPDNGVVHELWVASERIVAYASFSPDIVDAAIATLLDLPWPSALAGQRPTPIEQRVFSRLSGPFLQAIAGGRPEMGEVVVRIAETMAAPSSWFRAAPDSRVAVARFRLTIADRADGTVDVWWPGPASSRALSDSPVGLLDESEELIERHRALSAMERQVELLPVTLTAVFGPASVSAQQVRDLHPGQILRLGAPLAGQVAVQVEGLTKLWARPGDPRGGHAVRIVERKDTSR